MNPAPRFAPQRPFPAYAYLPGRDPHPTQDPRGHSYRGAAALARAAPAALAPLTPERWSEHAVYLYGCDLYNHGDLWEAHEAWEELWQPLKRAAQPTPLETEVADFLQGLIQCAAACLKIPMRQPQGMQRLAELSCERLERVARAHRGRFMGLELHEFAGALRAFVASAPSSIDARPRIELEPD